ncbi:MAG: efflux RND transporter periplasmic adaptor subunit [Pseudomonadota bacterium]
MLDLLMAAFVVVFAVLGVLRGVRVRVAGLVATLAAVLVWRFAMGSDALADLAATTPLPSTAIAALLAFVAFLALGFVLGRPLARRARPTPLSRLGGGVLGAAQGAALGLSVAIAGASIAPGVVAGERAAIAYPAVLHAGPAIAPTSAIFTRLPAPAAPAPPAAAPTQIARPVAWVRLADAGTRTLAREFTATVRAADRAPLAFEISGTIAAVTTRVGARVAAGEVLARLDETATALAVEERRAGLLEAEARLREATATFSRKRTLFERQVESEAAVDNARAAMETATARVNAAKSALSRAKDTLADTVLRAPYEGRIAAQRAEASEVVAAGAPVFEIEDASGTLEAVVAVPEGIVAELTVGEAHTLLGGQAPVRAVISEIGSRRAGEATFPVTLDLSDAEGLRPGATRRIALNVATGTKGVRLPHSAVVMGRGDEAFVFTLARGAGDQATARRQPVQVLSFSDDAAIVALDVPAGTALAVRGAAFLRDGQTVTLLGEGPQRFEELDVDAGAVLAALED